MKKIYILFLFTFIISTNLSAQDFKELPPPDSLIGTYADSTVLLEWQAPMEWDSLRFNIFKATVFDTSNINAETLQFQIIQTTKALQLEEHYSDIKNLSHISFMYYVVTKDTNDVESIRSNYCLVNIK